MSKNDGNSPLTEGLRLILAAVVAIGLTAALVQAENAGSVVRVGVLANLGQEQAAARWGPTAEYLSRHIPGARFEIIPLDFERVRRAVETAEVDFLITNSGYYTELEAAYGVSRVATLKNMLAGHVLTVFGGVIFTRTDQKDIKTLRDLKGRSFMAVERDSFGGWQSALREIVDSGLDPENDFSPLTFAGNHVAAVQAVRDGRVDAGTVRTDTLERMAAEGKINLADFRILNPKADNPSFPFRLSTRLYPEWPLARLRHTPDDLAEKVTIALLSLKPDDPAARSAGIAGWTVPLDYQPIHELMKELRIGPYQKMGQITLATVVQKYWAYLLAGAGALMIMTLVTGYVIRLNRKIERTRLKLDEELTHRKAAEEALNKANDELELRVQRRTVQLSEANEQLIRENARRLRVQEELRRQKEFNENIVQTASALILTLDESGDITMFNHHAEQVTGYSRSEALGRDWIDLLTPEPQREERRRLFEQLFNGGEKQMVHENDIVRRDGGTRTVSWQYSLLNDDDGRTFALLAIGVDVTLRRRAEEQARIQHEQLIQADKMVALGTLVAGVAHEINNPTTSIMMNAPNIEKMWRGLAKILDDHYERHGDFLAGAWPYSQARERLPLLLEGITDGARRVKRIVAELKDYARQEGSSGAVPVVVNQAVEKALSLLSNLIRKSTKSFRVELGNHLPAVLVQSQRLEQIMINLVMNACQALSDPSQGVLVRTEHDPEAGSVIISVRDEGEGIPPAHLNRVTDPFFTTRRETGGTGLGLAICARIVQDCGGVMRFESKEGAGTTVTVTLPALTYESGRTNS
ncbi:MAG: PhnD/SsuA/transferrin family substrate-binding protein [Thermodesulfobacteriota bacterium]